MNPFESRLDIIEYQYKVYPIGLNGVEVSEKTDNKKMLFKDQSRAFKIYKYLFMPCQNKLSMKVFDSLAALNEEQDRQNRLGYFISHPCSRFKLNWDVVIVAVLAFSMIMVPIQMVFYTHDQETYWMAFNWLMALIFAIDMLLHFCTGVISRDFIHLDRGFLRNQYMKTWFFFDLLGTIPFDNLMTLAGLNGNGESGKIFTIVSTFKLLQAVSLVKHINQWQEMYVDQAHRVYIKVINIIVSIVLLVHCNACLLYLFSMYQDFLPRDWVYPSALMEKDWLEKYIWCWFNGVSQVITLSFGMYLASIVKKRQMGRLVF